MPIKLLLTSKVIKNEPTNTHLNTFAVKVRFTIMKHPGKTVAQVEEIWHLVKKFNIKKTNPNQIKLNICHKVVF